MIKQILQWFLPETAPGSNDDNMRRRMLLGMGAAAGLAAGPINDIRQVFDDPQVRHRDMAVEVDHPTAGRIRLPGNPVSAFVTATLVAVPLLRAIAGNRGPVEPLRGRLTGPSAAPSGRALGQSRQRSGQQAKFSAALGEAKVGDPFAERGFLLDDLDQLRRQEHA